MAFRLVAVTQIQETVYNMVAGDGWIILRGMRVLHGLDRLGRVQWVTGIGGGSLQSVEFLTLPGLIVSPVVGSPLCAVRPSDGQIVWRGPPSPLPGRMCRYGDQIVLVGVAKAGQGSPLHLLSASGATMVVQPEMGRVTSIACVGERLFLGSHLGLFVSSATLSFSRIESIGGVDGLVAGESGLFFRYSIDERAPVGALLSSDWSQARAVQYPDPGRFSLAPTFQPGQVLAYMDDMSSLALVDLVHQQVAWRIQQAGFKVEWVAPTPHGVFYVQVDLKHEHTLWHIDVLTGTRSPHGLELPPGSVLTVHWSNGLLAVEWAKGLGDGDRRCYFYEWDDLPDQSRSEGDHSVQRNSGTRRTSATPRARRRTRVEPDELVDLVQQFAVCMGATGEEHRHLAREFNRRFSAWLAANHDQSVGTFAAHVAQAGGDPSLHGDVLADLVRLRTA